MRYLLWQDPAHEGQDVWMLETELHMSGFDNWQIHTGPLTEVVALLPPDATLRVIATS